jgi:hypothetical protein
LGFLKRENQKSRLSCKFILLLIVIQILLSKQNTSQAKLIPSNLTSNDLVCFKFNNTMEKWVSSYNTGREDNTALDDNFA